MNTQTATDKFGNLIHPFCKGCGWRQGGVDSWDGKACKCGITALAIQMIPASVEEHCAAVEARNGR